MRLPKLKLDDLRERIMQGGDLTAKFVLRELNSLPDSPEVWEVRGLCYEELGDKHKASDCFYRSYEMTGNERFLGIYANCILYIDSKKHEGLKILQGMADERKPLNGIYSALATFYWGEGEMQAALDVLEVALEIPELQTRHATYWLMAALTFIVCGEEEPAKDCCEEAFTLLMNRPVEFKDLSAESIRGAIKSQRFWRSHARDAEFLADEIIRWSTEAEDEDQELRFLEEDEELRQRLHDAVDIDWSSVTPEMWVTAEQFKTDLLEIARKHVTEER